MSSDQNKHSPRNRARRHFLGAAAGAAAKAVVLGAFASTLSSFSARAMGTKWWENGGGSGANCLLKGTLVDTSKGAVAVENLRIGDLIKTVDDRFMPVKWIGWQSYRKSGAEWKESVMPIRIARHAIDEKSPHRDLYVSPNHALFINGVLIRAKDLVNGRSVARVPMRDTVDYYNIVLDKHSVIMAEGAAVETYLMRGENYKSFTNFAEYQKLYKGESGANMQPFAPIVGYEGTGEHLRALVSLSGVFSVRDVVEETYQCLASRAVENVA